MDQNPQTDHWIRASKPRLLLAPMEGVTDAPMRAFLTELGGFDFCVTEFLRVSQNVLPAKVIRKHMPEIAADCRTSAGVPVQLQLLGGDPGRLAETAVNAVKAGALGIDLNFGCPAPTVNRHDGGASLLRHPTRLRAIVAAVRAAVPKTLPVSAKLRLGWESIDDIDVNAEMAAEGGASWIALHARTRMQGYRPPAWWKKIGEVRQRIGNLPLIANGEIWTRQDFLQCQEETGCEHFMIGRSALADPTLALWIQGRLQKKTVPESSLLSMPLLPLKDWNAWVDRFSDIAHGHLPTSRAVGSRIKQWVKFARMKDAFPWFDQIKTLETDVEIRAWLSRSSG